MQWTCAASSAVITEDRIFPITRLATSSGSFTALAEQLRAKCPGSPQRKHTWFSHMLDACPIWPQMKHARACVSFVQSRAWCPTWPQL